MRDVFAIVFFAGLTLLCCCTIHVVLTVSEVPTSMGGLVFAHIVLCAGYLALRCIIAQAKKGGLLK